MVAAASNAPNSQSWRDQAGGNPTSPCRADVAGDSACWPTGRLFCLFMRRPSCVLRQAGSSAKFGCRIMCFISRHVKFPFPLGQEVKGCAQSILFAGEAQVPPEAESLYPKSV